MLYLGTGASTITQMLRTLSLTGYTPESTVTLIFALIPILLGIWALRLGRPNLPTTWRRRISLAIVGVLGLVAWAGLLAGPVLALVAAVLPEGSGGKGTS
jgi:drug/metabolite transporter (DMT)-like permease